MSDSTYVVLETRMGWMAVAASDGKLAKLVLPVDTRSEAEQAVRGGMAGDMVETEHGFADLTHKLTDYFAGNWVDFDCEVDLISRGEFDSRVWAATREIPYREVRTYTWIAERIGRPHASRAVGQALGRNPVPVIVPCHRVVRSDGGLGGFSSGLEWKQTLLALERASRDFCGSKLRG